MSDIKRIITKCWPLIFILSIWMIFSSPYVFNNKIPFPSTYQVEHFHPWNNYKIYQGSIKNESLPDVVGELFPWKYLSITLLKQGQLPLWNPYAFTGNSLLANYQAAVFSPLNILFFILPFIDAWSILVLLQPLIAGFCTYLFMRQIKVGSTGAVISAIAYMFCGFNVVWMEYGTLTMTVAFLPLILYAIEKIFQKTQFQWGILLCISIMICIFSGHFQSSLYIFGVTIVYIGYSFYMKRDWKSFSLAATSVIVSSVICLVQILPSMQAYFYAGRSEQFNNSGGIPFYYLITLIAPDFFGNPVTRNNWFGQYIEWASFIGIIPLMLCFFSVFSKKSKVIIFFFSIGLLSLLFSLDTSIQSFIGQLKIPVVSTSYPTRIIFLLSFSLCVLAGCGTEVFMRLQAKKEWGKILWIIAVLGLLLLFIWIAVLFGHVIPLDKESVAIKNLIIPTLLYICFSLISLLFFMWKRIFLVSFLLLLLVSFDSIRFARKWTPFDSREYVFPDVPVISAMKQGLGTGRVFGNFSNEVSVYYQIPSIEGGDTLFPNRYGEFIRSAEKGSLREPKRYEVSIGRRDKYVERVLDLLGVTLIYHPISDTFQSWAFPVWENPKQYPVVYEDKVAKLFKNTNALPRAKMFYDYEIITDDASIIERFYSHTFDFRNTLILEQKPVYVKSTSKKIMNTVKIDSYSANKIVVTVVSSKSGILFLSDNYYPTWRVMVNGKKTNILRADFTFRAVEIPAGTSKVEFTVSLL